MSCSAGYTNTSVVITELRIEHKFVLLFIITEQFPKSIGVFYNRL